MARETIDQIARRLAESLPQGVKSVRDDLEQNFRTILNSGLARLELVTREEFEIQEAVLARTRAKLDALEARLTEIESGKTPAAASPSKKGTRKKTAKKTASKKKASKKTASKKKAASKKTTKKSSRKKPAGK